MKKIFILWTFSIIFASCNKNMEVAITSVRHSLSVFPVSVNFAVGEMSTKNVLVTTDAANWDATNTATWLTIEKWYNTLRITPNDLNTGTSYRSTTVIISVENTTPFMLEVTQAITSEAIYNTAEGGYFGNLAGTGTACFFLDLYHSSDPNIGVFIMGFSTLSGSFTNFKLDAGIYTLATSFAVRTFLPGIKDEDDLIGTIVYDYHAEKFILVTGGTFTVALSGSTYTITTNFTGKDSYSGAVVNDIRLNFTGTISFEDYSDNGGDDPPFGNIKESTYTATTGTPRFFNNGPDTWSGEIFLDEDQIGPYYTITNFFDDDWNIYADYVDGKIYLDDYSVLWEGSLVDDPGTFQAYLGYGVRYNGKNYVIPMSDPVEIQYNENSRILDFSNKVNIDFEGSIGVVYDLTLYIGIYAKPKPGTGSGTISYWIGDVYPDIKLQLTPISSLYSSKSIHRVKSIEKLRYLTSLLPTSSKNVITINGSQLTPDQRVKIDAGKLIKTDISRKRQSR